MHSQTSESISSRLASANIDYSLGDVAEIGHSQFSLDIWVLYVKIFAHGLSEVCSLTLLFEVNVAVVSTNGFSLISWLS